MAKPSLRAALIKAGLSEFRARGYSATGVQAITDRAGAPRGSFYGHFPSKEAFALAVLDSYEHWYIESTNRPDLRGVARLQFEFEWIPALAEQNNVQVGCLWGTFGAEVQVLSPALRDAVNGALDRWGERIGSYVAEAHEDVDLAAPDTLKLGRHLVMCWQGALWRARLVDTHEPLALFMELTVEPLLAAVRLAPNAVAERRDSFA